MEILKTEIEDIIVIVPDIFEDERGSFYETFSRDKFAEKVCKTLFMQDNQSVSKYGVVRGLHYQAQPHSQTKLVRVVSGRVLDVVVDVREGSPTFGKHVAMEISAENRYQLFIPRGFAHGFAVLSEQAIFEYKCDKPYAPKSERGIQWNDPALGIDWKIPQSDVILSDRDSKLPLFKDAEYFSYSERLYCQ